MTGDAYIISSGPSAERFDWAIVRPEDYILAVNFAGLLCPRFDAVVALDLSFEGTFKMYAKDIPFYTRTWGPALNGFTKVRNLKPILECAHSSSLSFGLCVLKELGYDRAFAVGCDLHTTGKWTHARKLIDLGLYPEDESDGGPLKKDAVEKTAKALKMEVLFFVPDTGFIKTF